MPPGVTSHGVPGPPTGSPRSARTFWTPARASESRMSSSSVTVCPTQVRCAIGVIEVSLAIRPVISMVRSRVVPPAPYVTETKVGRSCSSSLIDRHRTSSPAASLGGENSKENERSPCVRRVAMLDVGAVPMPGEYGGYARRVSQSQEGESTPVGDSEDGTAALTWDPAAFRAGIEDTLRTFVDQQSSWLDAL